MSASRTWWQRTWWVNQWYRYWTVRHYICCWEFYKLSGQQKCCAGWQQTALCDHNTRSSLRNLLADNLFFWSFTFALCLLLYHKKAATFYSISNHLGSCLYSSLVSLCVLTINSFFMLLFLFLFIQNLVSCFASLNKHWALSIAIGETSFSVDLSLSGG